MCFFTVICIFLFETCIFVIPLQPSVIAVASVPLKKILLSPNLSIVTDLPLRWKDHQESRTSSSSFATETTSTSRDDKSSHLGNVQVNQPTFWSIFNMKNHLQFCMCKIVHILYSRLFNVMLNLTGQSDPPCRDKLDTSC